MQVAFLVYAFLTIPMSDETIKRLYLALIKIHPKYKLHFCTMQLNRGFLTWGPRNPKGFLKAVQRVRKAKYECSSV